MKAKKIPATPVPAPVPPPPKPAPAPSTGVQRWGDWIKRTQTHPKPADEALPKNVALVHQMGYANVYQIERLSRLKKERGRTHLLMRASCQEAYWFVLGLAYAGWEADTFHCVEHTDDLTPFSWSRKLEENPWYPILQNRVVRTGKEKADG